LYLWIPWLRTHENIDPARIPTILSNLRSNWTTSGADDEAFRFMTDTTVRRIMKTVAPTRDETRSKLEAKSKNEKFPIAKGMMANMRSLYFLDPLKTRAQARSLDKIMRYMLATLQEETGQRVANWAQTKAEQAVLTRDVHFHVGLGEPNASGSFPNSRELTGNEARLVLMEGRSGDSTYLNLTRIFGVRINFLQTKTGVVVPNITIQRRTVAEAMILEDMGLWLCVSDTKDSDPFLTRYGVSALVTAVRSSGASRSDVNGRTGHVTNSTVSDTHYNYSLAASDGGKGGSAGPAALAESTTFCVEDLRRLIPLRATASRQLESIREDASDDDHEDSEKSEEVSSSSERPKRATRRPKKLDGYSLSPLTTHR